MLFIARKDLVDGVRIAADIAGGSENKDVRCYFAGFFDASNRTLQDFNEFGENAMIQIDDEYVEGLKRCIIAAKAMIKKRQDEGKPFHEIAFFVGVKSFIEILIEEGDIFAAIENGIGEVG